MNCFLAPILDVVTGNNPWLSGRTWTTNPKEIARVSSAYIRGIQQSGIAATAKHFPGFHDIPLDPAIESQAIVKGSFKPEHLMPFQDAIQHQVEMIMVGPAIVEDLDANIPATLEPGPLHCIDCRP